MKKTSEQMEKIHKNYVKCRVAIELLEDFDRLKQMVKEYPECIQYDDDGETLMHIAAKYGTPEMIEYLYHLGSDINRIYSEKTPVCYAVMENKTDNVKMLLKLGAEINSKTSVGNPMFDAVLEKNTEIAELLIDAGIDLTIQYAPRDRIWWDALSFAEYYHADEIAEMILEKFEKDGTDYDSIIPLTEEEYEASRDDDEEDDYDIEIAMEEYYEEHLGEIGPTYDEFEIQEQVYGDIRMTDRLDLYVDVIMPDETRNYITLITIGMSGYPMAETDDGYKYAELMMKLPPDWDVSEASLSDMTKNWPFRMLIKTAHLAHRFERKYVDETTVIPSGNPNDAILYFDGDTELSSVMLCRSEDIPPFEVDEETTVDFFTLIPITEGEAELVKKTGSEAVKNRLPKGEIVDMDREYLA